jgi:hypothetical protein
MNGSGMSTPSSVTTIKAAPDPEPRTKDEADMADTDAGRVGASAQLATSTHIEMTTTDERIRTSSGLDGATRASNGNAF